MQLNKQSMTLRKSFGGTATGYHLHGPAACRASTDTRHMLHLSQHDYTTFVETLCDFNLIKWVSETYFRSRIVQLADGLNLFVNVRSARKAAVSLSFNSCTLKKI